VVCASIENEVPRTINAAAETIDRNATVLFTAGSVAARKERAGCSMLSECDAQRKENALAASGGSRYPRGDAASVERFMTPGAFVRRVLGDRVFARVVEVYRAVFVNLDEVAACIPDLPADAQLLDVGGGDGALLDRILRRQPRLRAALVDLRDSVGLSLSAEHRNRVSLFPATHLRDGVARGVPKPDAVVLADVLHHVPARERESLLHDVAAFSGESLRFVVVKEVAPQGWRARLGLLSDWYVTGDRHVELLTPDDVRRLVASAFPAFVARETGLFERDAPNYCIVFERPR
jgi:hypothetical protein